MQSVPVALEVTPRPFMPFARAVDQSRLSIRCTARHGHRAFPNGSQTPRNPPSETLTPTLTQQIEIMIPRTLSEARRLIDALKAKIVKPEQIMNSSTLEEVVQQFQRHRELTGKPRSLDLDLAAGITQPTSTATATTAASVDAGIAAAKKRIAEQDVVLADLNKRAAVLAAKVAGLPPSKRPASTPARPTAESTEQRFDRLRRERDLERAKTATPAPTPTPATTSATAAGPLARDIAKALIAEQALIDAAALVKTRAQLDTMKPAAITAFFKNGGTLVS
jgi:hypothetical protein